MQEWSRIGIDSWKVVCIFIFGAYYSATHNSYQHFVKPRTNRFTFKFGTAKATGMTRRSSTDHAPIRPSTFTPPHPHNRTRRELCGSAHLWMYFKEPRDCIERSAKWYWVGRRDQLEVLLNATNHWCTRVSSLGVWFILPQYALRLWRLESLANRGGVLRVYWCMTSIRFTLGEGTVGGNSKAILLHAMRRC